MKTMPSLRHLIEALEEAEKAKAPQYETAIRLIDQIVTKPGAAELYDLPELLEEQAGYYAKLGRFDQAIAAMKRAIAHGWEGEPDGRYRIAEFLLQAGRADEAHALFATMKDDNPDQIYLYNVAAMAYTDVGDHERALQWLTEGLDLALRTDDPEGIADQLSAIREKSLTALGPVPDELQDRVRRYLREAEKRSNGLLTRAPYEAAALALEDIGDTIDEVVAIMAWFPQADFAAATERWPWLKARWRAPNHEAYSRLLQRRLLSVSAIGVKPSLVAIKMDAYLLWCERQGLEPGHLDSRERYAAELAARGKTIPWPPGRNDPCWCGSGKKYKRCCGTVELAPRKVIEDWEIPF